MRLGNLDFPRIIITTNLPGASQHLNLKRLSSLSLLWKLFMPVMNPSFGHWNSKSWSKSFTLSEM